jgi:hypothetical protein
MQKSMKTVLSFLGSFTYGFLIRKNAEHYKLNDKETVYKFMRK